MASQTKRKSSPTDAHPISEIPPATKTLGNRFRRFLKILGPGLITGASDDDPSGIGTYAMAGASLGYTPLWTSLVTFPLMAGAQLICARIGLVYRLRPGRHHAAELFAVVGLPGDCGAGDCQHDQRGRRYSSDCGRHQSARADSHSCALTVPVALAILVVQVWGSYRLIEKIFRWLTVSLFAYIGAAFLAHPNWSEVMRGTFVPTLRFDSYVPVDARGDSWAPRFRPTCSSGRRVRKSKSRNPNKIITAAKSKSATSGELRNAAWDVNAGMLLSNVVMYFIILATAATLHEAGKTEIDTATQAAEALRPIAGNAAYVLMALGLIGTGVLAVPILTGSAAYSVAELFNWKCGLDEKPHQAKGFYWVIAAATVVALLINFIGVKPMDALFWTAVINGFLSPPMLVIVMLIANNRSRDETAHQRADSEPAWRRNDHRHDAGRCGAHRDLGDVTTSPSPFGRGSG